MASTTGDESRQYSRRSADTEIAVLRSEFEAHRILVEQHREYEMGMLDRMTMAVERLGKNHVDTIQWRSDIEGSLKVIKWLIIYAPPVLVFVAASVWWVAIQIISGSVTQ